MIPVIFIHKGDHDYLTVAIEQAKLRNEQVVLLHEPKGLWGKDYEHMNTNLPGFEVFCFQRWFSLLEWMDETNREEAFYCDSDVMLYCNVTEVVRSWPPCTVSFQVPYEQWAYRWGASAHCSYWTHDELAAFCQFIDCTYKGDKMRLKEKWQWHRETGTPGGVCDMTLLYLWLEERGMEGFVNNAQVIDGTTFDHNINVAENYWPQEYRMLDGMKEAWMSTHPRIMPLSVGIDAPWGYNNELNAKIIFHALHFQGLHRKQLMKEYRG